MQQDLFDTDIERRPSSRSTCCPRSTSGCGPSCWPTSSRARGSSPTTTTWATGSRCRRSSCRSGGAHHLLLGRAAADRPSAPSGARTAMPSARHGAPVLVCAGTNASAPRESPRPCSSFATGRPRRPGACCPAAPPACTSPTRAASRRTPPRSASRKLKRVAAIYASPLERARETAMPIARARGLALRIERGLLELDVGEWTGSRLDRRQQAAGVDDRAALPERVPLSRRRVVRRDAGAHDRRAGAHGRAPPRRDGRRRLPRRPDQGRARARARHAPRPVPAAGHRPGSITTIVYGACGPAVLGGERASATACAPS